MPVTCDSITEWLERLKVGEAAAAQRLWDLYAARLVRIAKQRLGNSRSGICNEDDLALSVFGSVFRCAAEGRFDDVTTRDELWWLLLGIAKKKAINYARRETALKRGGNHHFVNYSLDELVSSTPTPELVVALEDEYARLMKLLPSGVLQSIAVLKIEGHTASEIAQQLSISLRAVERKLQLIRNKWKAELYRTPES